jgi:hypothetical protein
MLTASITGRNKQIYSIMDKEWIAIMKRTGRIKLSWWDLFTHYLIVPFLLMPLIFVSIEWMKYLITGEYAGVRTFKEMFIFNIPFSILAIAFYFIQYNRLNFKTIRTSISNDLIQEAINTTASELEWVSFINTKNYKVYKTFPKWYTGSWGEQITVILDNDKVMINSICDPDKSASVVSVGRNRKNMQRLIDKIENASR